ncbi:restriction endonuclease subunit S [Nocardia cyriacigeorgica]|uniref:Restriction endonuclease subunit S n=1 Tax=Nocardia cyriacigeorgica TaxID=135487 RepID=A0A6P1CTA7_9NOCA|nr:restriction endonuclease subunit S [Nocardia cyriacigeorgica]NEW35800.1 restriction endonuclease subunit S [Nocardia cyriacigeorgica]
MTVAEPKPLGQLLLRSPRYGINAAAVPLGLGLPTYIRITDIDDSGRFAPDPKVGVSHPKSSDYRMRAGELVFARTGASVGKSYLYDPRDGELVYAGFLINVAPDPTRLNPKYLSLFAQSKDYWDWIARTSVRSGQPGVNGQEYAQLPVPLPDIEVQNAIANAFTDVDNLIGALERKIAKKHAIKQGMMQQLLTGRTRLPGYTGEWAECHLGDVLAVRHGRNQRSVESPSGTVPILATGGQIGWADRPLYSEPSVLIGRKGTIDRPQYQDRPFWTVDTLFYTEISTKADPRFLFYLFQTIDWRSMNEASGVPSLSSTRIESVEVRLPGLAEQKAVREVLDDADVETTVLRARLAKARAIKTGMMQQLLTGRTRLPVEAAS